MSPSKRDLEDCAALLREGSHSFAAAARCLPVEMRAAATALYAFCRVADDLIDTPQAGAQQNGIEQLTRRLDDIFQLRPQNDPVDRALTAVVVRHQLSRIPFDALLEGMSWDADGRRYAELDELLAYCARVAASVGAMMAQIMGVRDAQAMARACDLGLAMQLSNIARDVGEDARAGRCYIPTHWFAQYGVDLDDWLQAPRDAQLVSSLVHRLLNEAERLYRQGLAGVPLLPRRCQPGILAAGWIYRDIGRQLQRRGLNPLQQRSVTSRQRKMALLLTASVRCQIGIALDRKRLMSPANPAVQFLVDACSPAVARMPQRAATAPTTADSIADQFGAVLDIFQRLGQIDRSSRT